MPNLTIQLDYNIADAGGFSWISRGIVTALGQLGINAGVVINGSGQLPPAAPFSDLSLYQYTAQTIQNSPLRIIAEAGGDWYLHLLLTTSHEQPSLLGLMYDFGFDARFRQGCAVFGWQVQAFTNNITADYQRVMLRTALHEIGHCLNFTHTADRSLMAPTSLIAGPGWIPNIQYQYAQEDIDYVRIYPDDSQPGGDTSNINSLTGEDTSTAWMSVPTVGISDLGGSKSRKFAAGAVPQFLVTIANQGEEPIQLPLPLHLNSENMRLWLKAPRKKVRLFQRPVKGCASGTAETVTIAKNKKKYLPVHLFADSRGYLFNTPGKYKVRVAVRLSGNEWARSRFYSFGIAPAEEGTGVLADLNSAEVLKSMVLKGFTGSQAKSRIGRMARTAKAETLRTHLTGLLLEQAIARPDEQPAAELVKWYRQLQKLSASPQKSRLIKTYYQATAAGGGTKPVPEHDARAIKNYQKFERGLIAGHP